MSEVRRERTGWRDEAISKRHRAWGWDCPALDIDFLLLEYDSGKPVALIEYKHEQAELAYPSHPSYRALIELGNTSNMPVFGVRYSADLTTYRVTPLNARAKVAVPARVEMTEREYVELLYRIRGRKMPVDLFDEGPI